MKHDFRGSARSSLKRAQDELNSGIDDRIRYVALELRFCIEALTYDRAQSYSDDLPPTEFLKWQPKKLLETLLEMEPFADTGGQVHLKEMTSDGETEKTWHKLGEERVFTLQSIKKSYDALGSYLHQPTLRQLNEGRVDFVAMRAKCIKILDELNKALSSSVFNINFRTHANFLCFQCESRVRKRLRMDRAPVEAVCTNCGAIYIVSRKEGGDITFERDGIKLRCRTNNCEDEWFIPRENVSVGTNWICNGCKVSFKIALMVIPQIDNYDKSRISNF